jgi:ABC-type branched-subunit amino acid transport system substrate-binding protein
VSYTIPTTSPDLTSLATKVALSNADCVYWGGAATTFQAFLPLLRAAGGKQRLVGIAGTIDPSAIKPLGKVADGTLQVTAYLPPTDPKWAFYNAAIKKYSKPSAFNWNDYAGQTAFLSVIAFADALKNATKVDTAKQVLAALNSAKSVNVHGLTRPINWSEPGRILPGSPRLVNPYVTYNVVKNGRLISLDGGRLHNVR